MKGIWQAQAPLRILPPVGMKSFFIFKSTVYNFFFFALGLILFLIFFKVNPVFTALQKDCFSNIVRALTAKSLWLYSNKDSWFSAVITPCFIDAFDHFSNTSIVSIHKDRWPYFNLDEGFGIIEREVVRLIIFNLNHVNRFLYTVNFNLL